MFVEVVRLLMVVLGTAAGFLVGADIGDDPAAALAGVGGMVGCLLGYVIGGALGRMLLRAVGAIERRVDRLPPASVLAGLVGGTLGGVAGATLAAPLVLVLPLRLAIPLGGLVVWIGAYAGFRIAVRESEALLNLFGLSTRPLLQATRYDRVDGLLVDTSAIMDGQLLALSRSGLLRDDLLVPRFVLDELQGLADEREGTRARRARHGLETLEVLRRELPARVFVLDNEIPEHGAVDAKLVALARRLQIRLLTNDVNLQRVAEVQGVATCNLRRLASDLGPAIIVGETMVVELTGVGRHPGQGVGFLEDGSMVVVNDGADLVGVGQVDLVVTSVVPTSAGRIVFARPAPAAGPSRPARAEPVRSGGEDAATRQY